MYVMDAVALGEPPLDFWHRIVRHDAGELRALALQMAAEGGPLRTLLGFRQPGERRGPVTFDWAVRPGSGPGGALFLRWDAELASLEGELEVIPDGAGHQLRLSASYEPPWAASLVADRSVLGRLAGAAVREFLQRAASLRPVAVGGARHRVLIEDESPAWHRVVAALPGADECEFDACQGPALVPGGCPVLRDETCSKVEWADVILNSLDDAQPENAAVFDALQRAWPEASVTRLEGKPATRCLVRHPTTAGAS